MCKHHLIGICLSQPPATAGEAIFGFGDFLTALALLVLVYNSTDPLYRFRISVAPIRLYPLTFWTTLVVGGGSLLTDLWFQQRWYAPAWGVNRGEIQAVLGLLFLGLVSMWTWFAFVRPASFGRFNASAYFSALYGAVVRGSEKELAAVASELGRSGAALVRYAAEQQRTAPGQKPSRSGELNQFANQALLLLGDRKLCRHIVANSPDAAIIIMGEASSSKKHRLPLGPFAQSITIESLLNRDSKIFHEDGIAFGLAGHWRPFTNALFGDFDLIEKMEGGSPFSLGHDVEISPAQLEAYCRIVKRTLRSYVELGCWGRSHSLHEAFETIERIGTQNLHDLNGAKEYASKDSYAMFRISCQFVRDAVKLIGDESVAGRAAAYGRLEQHWQKDLLDDLSEVAFGLIKAASYVREPRWSAWGIQYSIAWQIFDKFNNTRTCRIFCHKLSRLLYESIKELNDFPNYQSSGVLNIVLNCVALGGYLGGRKNPDYAIGRAAVNWARFNYVRLLEVHPPVAANCIEPCIVYDKDGPRLIRRYNSDLSLTPVEAVLDLLPST